MKGQYKSTTSCQKRIPPLRCWTRQERERATTGRIQSTSRVRETNGTNRTDRIDSDSTCRYLLPQVYLFKTTSIARNDPRPAGHQELPYPPTSTGPLVSTRPAAPGDQEKDLFVSLTGRTSSSSFVYIYIFHTYTHTYIHHAHHTVRPPGRRQQQHRAGLVRTRHLERDPGHSPRRRIAPPATTEQEPAVFLRGAGRNQG